jgi:hypothetical protein
MHAMCARLPSRSHHVAGWAALQALDTHDAPCMLYSRPALGSGWPDRHSATISVSVPPSERGTSTDAPGPGALVDVPPAGRQDVGASCRPSSGVGQATLLAAARIAFSVAAGCEIIGTCDAAT